MSLVGIYVRTSVDHENTSIDQQKELGIRFCNDHGFQYQIYEDIGKSGFKIDDENDPFKNRRGLTKLIDDIENKIIDKIWVFEHSRLSRNQYASFILHKIFERKNIIVYENGKQFKMDDPQSQMIQGILTQISQYERHLITNRLKRGKHKLTNSGHRSYPKVYGYKQTGKTAGGYLKWEPVQSEIENLRYLFENYLWGETVLSILKELFKNKTDLQLKMIHRNFRNALNRFDYTGYSLTTEGAELYKKFQNFEIESLDFLNEQENGKPKYYLKSVNYPVEVVTLEDWIKANEKHNKSKLVYKNNKRKTDTDIFTGLINCPYCNCYYYLRDESKKAPNLIYYSHLPSKKCLQSPKSIRTKKVNSLAEVFYFYYYLVYDDTKELLEENQKIVNLNLLEIKDKISAVESENRKLEKQINNLQNIYEESTDQEFVKMTLKKETELNLKLESNNSVITKYKLELDELTEELNRDKMELTFHSVKDLVINFFEKLNTEEKRSALIKIIKKCQLFTNYLLIDTGKLLFVFNIKQNYELPEDTYNEFKNDEHFKENFLNSVSFLNENGEYPEYIQSFLDTPAKEAMEKYTEMEILEIESKLILWHIARRMGELRIKDYFLSKPENRITMQEKLDNLGIDYNLENISKVISFTDDI